MRLLDPFRPELGRMTAGAFASRLTTNLPSVLASLGEGVSTKRMEWERILKLAQRRIVGKSIISPKCRADPGLRIHGSRPGWAHFTSAASCLAHGLDHSWINWPCLDDAVARAIHPLYDAFGMLSVDLCCPSIISTQRDRAPAQEFVDRKVRKNWGRRRAGISLWR